MHWALLIAIAATAIGSAVYFYWSDRRYERRRTREALSDAVCAEIERERQAAATRREKFQQALKDAADHVRNP